MIRQSFEVCGIYPFFLPRVLQSIKRKISLLEERRIMAVFPTLVELMRTHGKNFDDDLKMLESLMRVELRTTLFSIGDVL